MKTYRLMTLLTVVFFTITANAQNVREAFYYPGPQPYNNDMEIVKKNIAQQLKHEKNNLKHILVLDDRIEFKIKRQKTTIYFADILDSTIVVKDRTKMSTGANIWTGEPTPITITRFMDSEVNFGNFVFIFKHTFDCQAFAENLFFIQYKLKEKRYSSQLTLFEQIAAQYRVLSVKPPVTEEQRKHIVQANSFNEQKRYNKAIDLYLKAIEVDQTAYPAAYSNLALLSAQIDNYEAAIYYLKKYLMLEPEDARAAQDKIYEWEGKITAAQVGSNLAMQNQPKQNTYTPKPKFFIRTGLSIPKYDFAKKPSVLTDTTFMKRGNMGAKTGFFIEAGVGMKLYESTAKVQFYYNPFILYYAQNNMDWDSLEGLTVDTLRNLRMIEVAQRYGISYEPVPKVLIAVFYRPGLFIPFDFELDGHKTTGSSITNYSVNGTMTELKSLIPFKMSHTFGFSVTYSFVSLSFESYFALPNYDVTIINHGPLQTNPGDFEKTTTIKIPFRTNRIGIAFTF